MSLINFLQSAGEKLFGHPASPPPAAAATSAATPAADPAALDAAASQAITNYVAAQHLAADQLAIRYQGTTQTVTVSGTAPDQATKEKIVLCCGNVASVAKVDDQLTVAAAAEPPSTYHEVKSGDTLSKIAKETYGDANKYMVIFDANKPMLSNPDKIYPGQLLRLPPA